MKRTLLDDLIEIYYSLKCVNDGSKQCFSCKQCKNNRLCNKVYYLIYSIRNHYNEVIK